MPTTDILVVVPARGGSKRVKNKNLLTVGDVPLVTLAVDTIVVANEQCDVRLFPIVSTDDVRIQAVVPLGVPIHLRENVTDEETIGDMLGDVVASMEWEGPVAVMQPTSIPQAWQVVEMVKQWVEKGAKEYWSTATPMSGLYWNRYRKPLYDQRVNSQQLGPVVMKENGALRIYPAGEFSYSRDPDHIHTLSAVDIDTWGDLQQVRSFHDRGQVVFSITATEKTGAGHLYRCISIAQELQHHDVTFALDGLEDWAVDLLRDSDWHVSVDPPRPHSDRHAVWVYDLLDTERYMVASRIRDGYKVICIEDRGPGALKADLVINAMYPGSADHEVNGSKWAVIRPEFLLNQWEYRPGGSNVLVLFGGTDPKDLTWQVAHTLSGSDYARAVVMTGPGYKGAYDGGTFDGSVSEAMVNCDLLVTSGGRTVYEAAAIGIPTVVVAQNLRETSHQHITPQHGNLYLGMADTVPAEKIREVVEGLLLFPEPRLEMSERSKAMVDGKGARRIVRRIEDMLEGL